MEALEQQFKDSEAKRLEGVKQRTALLEQYKDSLKVESNAEALEKEVLMLAEEQRNRLTKKMSELLQFRSDLALTDAELVKLEKQYLALLNKKLER